MDMVAVSEGLVGQVGQQSVVLSLGLKLLHSPLSGDKRQLGYIGDLCQNRLEGSGLLLGQTVIYIDHHLVFILQITQHIV